ncbi:macrophage metalloelastase [Exaiptasia diaphana]|uniref:ShKT domain-containing protein n=1 Tax=Exaiptasia diaphana TaxID=2652724 RepID=A0A913Y881_EXADI|nr:macrophage metalloelastase [Exaiptasia diaphana]KXJ21533.1 50 kDa hatching enzyme [Exaiptasia diaphana]
MLYLLIILSHLAVVLADDDKTFALKYLDQYHYISPTRSGTHDVNKAIKNFQQYFHLPVSGKLDEATVGLMKKSRCGVSDEEGGARRRRYVTVGNWGKTNLTYYVDYGDDLGKQVQDRIFYKAFQFWADVSMVTFTQVDSPKKADIKISFGYKSHDGTTGEHMCAYPFDGEGGVLAHAYFPDDGRAHFDEAERFTHESLDGTDLLWVATHEFGHSLGLEHTNIEGAVMYPYYNGYKPNMKLHSDDIAGIQSLYGAPQKTNPTKQPLTTPVCKDKLEHCPAYKNANYCSIYKEEMSYWCAKTCGLC